MNLKIHFSYKYLDFLVAFCWVGKLSGKPIAPFTQELHGWTKPDLNRNLNLLKNNEAGEL